METRDICMEFSGVKVLNNVNFTLRRGEVHALLGENGAGKSTLVKILMGVYSKTSGKLFLNGEEVNFKKPADATSSGIGIIFQEFSQVPHLSVAENLFLGRMPKIKILGGLIEYLDWNKIKKLSKQILEELNLDIDLDAKVGSIGVAQQQIVEIAKALLLHSNVLIMDEPTAALSSGEINSLFEIINDLKSKGISIIYISHRMEEIGQICDRATILRNGEKVDTVEVKQTSTDTIIRMMVGKELKDLFPQKHENNFGQSLMSVSNLSCNKGKFKDINFEVRSGEIVGITGLVGAGKTEVLRAIFGADKHFSGEIYINGKKTSMTSPIEAIKNGMAFIPEDRKFQGLITALSAKENIILGNYKKIKGKFKLIKIKKEKIIADKYFGDLAIRPNKIETKVRFFSGGNQQKIVVSKWLCSNAQIYLFDEPTRGVDVGAKAEIYKLISNLADSGCAIIVSSSEIEEVIGLCDRIIVLNKGHISGEYTCQEGSYEKILKSQVGGF